MKLLYVLMAIGIFTFSSTQAKEDPLATQSPTPDETMSLVDIVKFDFKDMMVECFSISNQQESLLCQHILILTEEAVYLAQQASSRFTASDQSREAMTEAVEKVGQAIVQIHINLSIVRRQWPTVWGVRYRLPLD